MMPTRILWAPRGVLIGLLPPFVLGSGLDKLASASVFLNGSCVRKYLDPDVPYGLDAREAVFLTVRLCRPGLCCESHRGRR
jgi:hypothetical protein